MCGELRTHRLVKKSKLMNSKDLQIDFAKLVKVTHSKRSILIRTASWVHVPAVWGIFHPILLIPEDTKQHFTRDQLRWILLHELAHISRWDTGVVLFQKLIQYLFFFHPGVWFAKRIIDRQRELFCDDIALTGCDSNRRECGEGFLKVVEMATPLSFLLHTGLGVLDSKTSIQSRLIRILDPSRMIRARLSYGGIICFTALSLLILPLSLAQNNFGDTIFPLRGPGGELILGHGTLWTVAFSPDGKYFLTGGTTGIYLREFETGKIIRTYLVTENPGMLTSLSFSPDGTKIFSSSENMVGGPASVWDVASGKKLCSIDWGEGAALSPDGALVAAIDWQGLLWLCDSQTGEVIRELPLQKEIFRRNCLAFSPNGDEIIIVGEKSTIFLDPVTGGVLRVFEQKAPGAGVAVSHDGTQYVIFEDDPSQWKVTAIVKDWQTGEVLHTYGPYEGSPSIQVSYSPDDSKILFTDYQLKILDLVTNKVDTVLSDYECSSAAFSPDGKFIIAVLWRIGEDLAYAAILDSSSGKILKTFKQICTIGSIYTPDRKKILTAGNEAAVYEWNAETGELLHTYNQFSLIGSGFSEKPFSPEDFFLARFSPDGTKILAVVRDPLVLRGFPTLFDIQTGAAIKFHNPIEISAGLEPISFSPDGSRYLTAYQDMANLWDANTGESLGEIRIPYQIEKFFFSADGRKIFALISKDRSIGSYGWVVWDAEMKNELFLKFSDLVNKYLATNICAQAFSPDGTLLAVGPSLHNIETGEVLKTFLADYLVLSPDGNTLATVTYITENGSIVTLWDIAAFQITHTLQFKDFDTDLKATFSPDGSILVLIINGSLKLWDVRTGEELGDLGPYSGVGKAVLFSSDGSRLVTWESGYFGTEPARVWDISQWIKKTAVKSYSLH